MQRLVSYNYKGESQWGVLSADGTSIYPAIDLEETYFIPLAETLGDFIESGEEGLLNLAHALEMNGKDKAVAPIALADVRLEAPFSPRRNVLCVGKNYQAHVKEFDQNANAKNPEDPIFFTKATTSIIGPDEEIDSHPTVTQEVDYEGELGVIIGKRGTNIAEEDAMKYVYGYTIINDVTARACRKSTSSGSAARASTPSARWARPSWSVTGRSPSPSTRKSMAACVRKVPPPISSSPFRNSSRLSPMA